MPRIKANGLDIEYESFGPDDAEAILLIMGLGAQLTQWPLDLCEILVARGYRVIRFDNRDAGLSSRLERDRAFAFSDAFFALAAGKSAFAPYSLSDMGNDAVGLLDALGIEQAHIVGASMGGMIAQHVVADHPTRCLSLTSIMSSSGNPMLPPPRPKVLSLFMSQGHSHDTEAVIAKGIKTYEVIGSPGFPTDAATLREWVERDAARAYYPQGVMRQMAAVLSDGDRRARLRQIKVPTVVLHGRNDPLVPMAAGEDTAANIEGAELRVIDGMGHDLPLALVPQIADAIVAAAERATGVQLVPEVAEAEIAAVSVAEVVSDVVAAVQAVVAPDAPDGIAEVQPATGRFRPGRFRRWLTKQRQRWFS
ncbi:MAG: alpha/beta hydrolase [Parvibaculum sp.]|nr:alpha/beta hydrolase [Parvibaculum sp.]